MRVITENDIARACVVLGRLRDAGAWSMTDEIDRKKAIAAGALMRVCAVPRDDIEYHLKNNARQLAALGSRVLGVFETTVLEHQHGTLS